MAEFNAKDYGFGPPAAGGEATAPSAVAPPAGSTTQDYGFGPRIDQSSTSSATSPPPFNVVGPSGDDFWSQLRDWKNKLGTAAATAAAAVGGKAQEYNPGTPTPHRDDQGRIVWSNPPRAPMTQEQMIGRGLDIIGTDYYQPTTEAGRLTQSALTALPFAAMDPAALPAVLGGAVASQGASDAGLPPLLSDAAGLAGGWGASKAANLTATRLFGPRAPAPASPSGGAGATADAPPMTADEAFTRANDYYTAARQVNATLPSSFANDVVDSAEKILTRDPGEVATVGSDAGDAMLARWKNDLKGTSLDFQTIQGMDRGLTRLISDEYKPNGITDTGRRLQQVQQDLRDRVDKLTDTDLQSGSTAGFDALSNARKAWQQARKLDDVESMWQRAQGTTNPAQSFKTQVNNFVNNTKKIRGYSDDEVAALKDAASRGVIGNTLKLLGSNLMPYAGFLHSGIGGAAAGAGIEFAAQKAQSALQQSRLNEAMRVISGSAPPPVSPPPPPVPAPRPYFRGVLSGPGVATATPMPVPYPLQ